MLSFVIEIRIETVLTRLTRDSLQIPRNANIPVLRNNISELHTNPARDIDVFTPTDIHKWWGFSSFCSFFGSREDLSKLVSGRKHLQSYTEKYNAFSPLQDGHGFHWRF